jgi:hypothetical protein
MRAFPVFPFLLLALLATGVARATSVIPPSFSELVGRAERVTHGVVTEVRSDWSVQAGFRVIKTWVTVRLEEELKASGTESSVTLEFLGGRMPEGEMRVEGSPRFQVGEEILVFVAGNGADACPLVGWGHGAFRVAPAPSGGGKHVVRMNGLPLRSPSEVELPLTSLASGHPALRALALQPGLSLAAFKDAIRQERGAVEPHAR